MDQIIETKNFEILGLKDTEVLKTVRLLAIFGNNGTEVIFITNEDNVYGFGTNKNGCLGLGSREHDIREPKLSQTLTGKEIKDIVCGFEHCIALTKDGQCYGWGSNDYSRLGIGTYDSVPTPQLVKDLADQNIVQIAIGIGHSLALTSDGKLYSWGRNNWGQLGIRHYRSRYLPNLVEITPNVILISCGINHSIALTDCQQLYVWGLNDSGQMGIHPNSVRRPGTEKPSTAKPHLLSNFAKNIIITKVVCGRNHSLILTTNGWIFSFGNSTYGQSGYGQREQKFNPSRIDNGVFFKDIIANNQNNLSLAVSEDNMCYVWGFSHSGPEVFASDPLAVHSLFDIYAKLVKFKITFKTIVVNEDNKQFNERKYRIFLKTKDNCEPNINRINNLLQKNSIPANNGSDSKPDETKKPNNGSVVTFEEQNTTPAPEVNKRSVDKSNNRMNETQRPSQKPTDIETNSLHSVFSDDYFSCITRFSKGGAGLKFLHKLSQSFDKYDSCDLKFVFNDKKHFYCHKTVLRLRNDKFWNNCCRYLNQSYGYQNLMPIREAIYVRSHSYAPFHVFVQYLYGFEPDLNTKTITDIIKMAQIYEEPELIDLCYQYIQQTDDSLNVMNVCTLYKKAIEDGLTELEKFCIEFATKNWKTICKSDAFQALNDSICEQLMSQVFSAKKSV